MLWVTVRPRIQRWIDDYRARAALNEVRERLAEIRETSQPATPEVQNDDGTEANNNCVICWSNAREIANRPCGHVCSCLNCYEAMPSPKHCPVCRSIVTEVIPIFIS